MKQEKKLEKEIEKLFDDELDQWDNKKDAIREAFLRGMEFQKKIKN